jgi:uncharacterized protein (TIGR02594 family)
MFCLSIHSAKGTEVEDSLNLETGINLEQYLGISKSVIMYLESQNPSDYLSNFLIKNSGIEIDMNQAKLLNYAASMYGLKEIIGDSNNFQILNFFNEMGHPEITNDEMSWCSSYMSWCAKQMNLIGSNGLLARSWLEVGEIIEKPKVGDIVIFWRETKNSWQGHVGIYLNENPTTHDIYCLGGNQDDKVCVKSYPAIQLLGYRRLQEIK